MANVGSPRPMWTSLLEPPGRRGFAGERTTSRIWPCFPAAFRRRSRSPTIPIHNMIRTVESAGALVYRVDFATRLLDAVSHWSPGMPPLFFLNDDAPPDRLRFSLAHELGHVVMHSVPTDNMEKEADRFA